MFSEAGQSFYQQQAQQSEAQPAGDAGQPSTDGAQAPQDDVVEADYEIVDDKK